MSNIVSVINDMDALLKDGTDGVQQHLDDIASEAANLSRIFGTFDEPRRARDTPYLVAMHTQTTPTATDGQGFRDWDHNFDFWYKPSGGDQEERRKNAAWTAQAVIRTISPKRKQVGDLISDACDVEVTGASILWGRDVDGRSELLILRAVITARERW